MANMPEKNVKEAKLHGVNVSLMDRVVWKHRQERRKAHSEVQAFLKTNGFNSGKVNELKGFLSRTSPLHEAVKQKNPSVVAALLQLGADADFRDFPMGRTAFEYAERSDSRSSAELTQIFRQCGCAPDSYQFCKTRQLTHAPWGFEAFFAEKEKDPLAQRSLFVKIHLRSHSQNVENHWVEGTMFLSSKIAIQRKLPQSCPDSSKISKLKVTATIRTIANVVA